MTAFGYLAFFYRLTNGATFFIYMSARCEFTIAEIRSEFPKAVEKLIFKYSFSFFKIKRREARSISNIAAAYSKKLTMACCMPASAEFFACLPCFKSKPWIFPENALVFPLSNGKTFSAPSPLRLLHVITVNPDFL